LVLDLYRVPTLRSTSFAMRAPVVFYRAAISKL
jgi:hypothetical protein